MNKVLRVILVVFMFCSFMSIKAAEAASPPPENPWLSEIIDYQDDDVDEAISLTRLPGTSSLAVAYAGDHWLDGKRMLKFALQVPEGSGNCGDNLTWRCGGVDMNEGVGLHNAIAAIEDPDNENQIIIGISYYDDVNRSLKYAQNFYNKTTQKILDQWEIITISVPAGNTFSVGETTDLVFNPYSAKPIVAYRLVESIFAPNPMVFLRTATVVGDNQGNCGPSLSWSCKTIQRENFSTTSFANIKMGWIDYDLYYFYNSVNGLDYAHPYDGGAYTQCFSQDYMCGTIDNGGSSVGYELRVASWRGNYSNFPNYRADARSNGVFLVYMQKTSTGTSSIKYAYTQKSTTGVNCSDSKFSCFTFRQFTVLSPSNSLSVAIDPNFYEAFTYSTPGYDIADLQLVRPATAFGLEEGNCGTIPYIWVCETVLQPDLKNAAGKLAALDIGAGNLVSIVYNAYSDTETAYRLGIIRQDWFKLNLPNVMR